MKLFSILPFMRKSKTEKCKDRCFHENLGSYLIDKKVITLEQLETALDIQREHGHKRLGEILAEIDAIGEAEVLELIAQFMKTKSVNLDEMVFPLKTQTFFSKILMRENCFAPFELSGNTISIAISDIKNQTLIEEITNKINSENEKYHIDFYLTLSPMLKRFIDNSYSKFPHKRTILFSKKKTFGEYLLENSIVTAEQLDEVLKYQKIYVHKRLGDALADLNILDKKAVLTELAKHENHEYVELSQQSINIQPHQYFAKMFMSENNFVPFALDEEELKIAIGNIFDDELKNEINNELLKHNLKARFYLASKEEIEKLIS